jgi:hypothetical protein
MNIFLENAPNYWGKGLPVIPLRPKEKVPIPYGWQRFANTLPTNSEQAEWLTAYPTSNLGLPLGEKSGCIAIDIDTNDPVISAVLSTLLPSSPWIRTGAKGSVRMYKYNGEQTFRIKGVSGESLVELLSSRTQVVLPPSIHPNTQLPYTANCELLDVVDNLPVLPSGFEDTLRNALIAQGIELSHSGWTRTTEYISQGSRDVKMTSMAGFFANGVTRGELSLKEAIRRMYAWYESCTERVAGDDINIDKGISNLISFMMNDVRGAKKKSLPIGWDEEITEEERKNWGLDFKDEEKAWDVKQIKEYLLNVFQNHGVDTPARSQAIDFALQRISANTKLTTLEVDSVLKYIINVNSQTMSMGSLRKRLVEIASGGLIGTDHTEIAGEVLNELSKIGIVVKYEGLFWRWGGSHWEKIGEQDIQKLIALEFGHLPAAKKFNDHKGIMQVMGSLVNQTMNIVPGVNFANGFLTKEGKLLPHDPSFGSRYTLPYRYIGGEGCLESCPLFSRLLHSFWGHEKDYAERVECLRQMMAVTFMGMGTSYARALLLHGLGGTGKSQLIKIMERLLPSNVVSYVAPYEFTEKFSAYPLSNSLINICGELDEKKPLPGASFKSVIDGSTMQGRQLFGQIFNFTPKATHWFASNHLPRSADTSEGFYRRWVVLTFNRIVPKSEIILNFGEIIAAEERENIVSWFLRDIKGVMSRNIISLPPSHFAVMNDIQGENDSAYFYLVSAKGPKRSDFNVFITEDKLYEAYSGFCYSVEGSRPIGARKFKQRVREMSTLLGLKVEDGKVKGLSFTEGVPLGRVA